MVVQLSGANHEAKSLVVGGTVEVVENAVVDKSLSTDWIVVDGGIFRIGTEVNPYDTNTFTLTLEGDNPTQNLPALGISDNDAFLLVRSGGSLQLFGEPQRSWTQLGTTAMAGTSSITLKQSVTWAVGDEIVIASTTFEMNEAETRTIVAVSGDQRTVTLDSPLTYTHFGELQNYNDGAGTNYTLDERAEVGLLSRNIKIQGDADSAVDGIGGNLMFLATAGAIHIDGVEFYHMGQKARLGRYPIHWHLAGDREGDYIENSSIHHTFNRALTIHGAHNILVSQTVAYDHIGHGYFLEDAVETGNRFYYNLGLVTREPQPGEELLPSDLGPKQFQISGPGTFWITNPNNELVGNVAAGSQTGSGFWYALPSTALGLSSNNSQYNDVNPRETPLGIFRYNRAHSNAVGLDVDGGPEQFSGVPESSHYSPPEIANFSGFTAFANSKNGVYFRGTSNIHLPDARLADNVQGTMFAFGQTISDSLIVGVSDNDFGGPTKHGFAVYDGPNTVTNVHFAGFNNPGAGLFTVIGAAERHVHHVFEGITFDDPATPFSFPDTVDNNTIARNWGFSLYDEDGSLTGTAGQSVVYDHPMMRSDGDVVFPDWQKAAVSGRQFGHLRLMYDLSPAELPLVTVARTGGPGEDVVFSDPLLDTTFNQLGVIMNTDFTYTFNYDTSLVSDTIDIKIEEVKSGDFVYVRVNNPWEWVEVTDAAAKVSEQDVRDSNSTAYFTVPGGDVFLKLVVESDSDYETIELLQSTIPRDLTVDTIVDELDADTGPGDLSLREAIDLANARVGFDVITFAPTLDGQTVLLVLGSLTISDSVSIDASSLAGGLTIDASGNDPTPDMNNGDGSFIFYIRDGSFLTNIDVQLRALALTGGDTDGSGGAIVTTDSLTLIDSAVFGNASTKYGGGIMVLVFPQASTTIINSTISGNQANYGGGGIAFQMSIDGTATIRNSTITNNTADADSSGDRTGGGLFVVGSVGPSISHTIVAGNFLGGGADDDISGPVQSGSANNLVGVGTGAIGISDGSNGNHIGSTTTPIDPMLGPLAGNGGPTLTHALLSGSAAIDAGDPTAVAGVGGIPLFDQRGALFDRVLGAAMDIGAFEFTPITGDGNADGTVDGLDYLLWANFFGDDPAQDPPGAPANGDYNEDGMVDGADYLVWVEHYGAGAAASIATVAGQTSTPSVDELKAVDAVLEDGYDASGATVADDRAVRQWQLSRAFDSVLERVTGSRRAEKRATVALR
jgi:hypothetical protein